MQAIYIKHTQKIQWPKPKQNKEIEGQDHVYIKLGGKEKKMTTRTQL